MTRAAAFQVQWDSRARGIRANYENASTVSLSELVRLALGSPQAGSRAEPIDGGYCPAHGRLIEQLRWDSLLLRKRIG